MSAALAHDPSFDPASAPARDPSGPASGAPTPIPTPMPRRLTLRDRAWDLHCEGHRSPAIAATLGVPERTVRAWLASIRDELRDELATERAAELLRAVESLRQLCVSAWDAYDRSTRRDDDILAGKHDFLSSRRILRAPSHAMKSAESATSASLPPQPRTPSLPSSASAPADVAATGHPGAHALADPAAHDHILAESFTRPRLANQAPALLRVILSAQVEIAKLLDLSALARAERLAAATASPDASFPARDEETETDSPAESAAPGSDDPDLLLWYERDDPTIPAESARSATLDPDPSPDPSPDLSAPFRPITPAPHVPFPLRDGGRGLGSPADSPPSPVKPPAAPASSAVHSSHRRSRQGRPPRSRRR